MLVNNSSTWCVSVYSQSSLGQKISMNLNSSSHTSTHLIIFMLTMWNCAVRVLLKTNKPISISFVFEVFIYLPVQETVDKVRETHLTNSESNNKYL